MLPIRLISIIAILSLLAAGCGSSGQEEHVTKTKTDSLGNKYTYVTNDPYGARIYELDNGLKVYLTVDKEEPRVQTLIAVRAGSASEQRETTGLAHYLEHMLFKGTDKFGTLNWEKEKALLDSISMLYEKRKALDDSAQKAEIYRQIDSLSQIAAKYAIPNEYDKMISTMGGDNTNAFTSKDRTVYMNNIPTNELHKWIELERERFRKMVLRLFHTELETVFEEFNRSQDSDYRKASDAMNKALFQGHNYQLSTIGKPEHLKDPSMVNVHAFKDEYYVPNNMAICLSGDLDPAQTYQQIKEQWGDMEPNDDLKKERDHGEANPIDEPVYKTVQGPEAERVYLGYRFSAENEKNQQYVRLIDNLLYNGQAGLIDLNLVKEQKVLEANSSSNFYNEYGKLQMYGQARPEQSLEDVEGLLLEQIEKIKSGDFPDWMLEAVILNLKKDRIQERSSNWKAFQFVDAFIKDSDWARKVNYLDELSNITKSEVAEFARQNLDSNYVVVYKRSGEDTAAVRVSQPPITPVDINRNAKSDFRKQLEQKETKRIDPVFVDYDQRIDQSSLSPEVDFNYLENKENELFTLYYVLDIGDRHDKQLSLAIDYLDKLGTDKYSPSELEQEFYKLGLSMGVSAGSKRSYVYISGLPDSMRRGIELLEHVLANAKVDTSAYHRMVDNIIQERANQKKQRIYNLIGLFNYGIYGPHSGFTDHLSKETLRNIDPNDLVKQIHHLYDYEHYMVYHGKQDPEEVKSIVADYHEVPEQFKPTPPEKKYESRETTGDSVFFVNYDMVQANVILVSRDEMQDTALFPYARMYNQFYGSGLSSVVFQEIRESKGLAYSARSSYSRPDTGYYHFSTAILGTQYDKTNRAVKAMSALLQEMPEASRQFENAKVNILKEIETNRITGTSIYWNYMDDREKGFEADSRQYIYQQVQDMTMADMEKFFREHIKGNNYDLLIMGKKEDLPPASLSEFGVVTALERDELFGY